MIVISFTLIIQHSSCNGGSQNILLNNTVPIPVISDFGNAVRGDQGVGHHFIQPYEFRTPEVSFGMPWSYRLIPGTLVYWYGFAVSFYFPSDLLMTAQVAGHFDIFVQIAQIIRLPGPPPAELIAKIHTKFQDYYPPGNEGTFEAVFSTIPNSPDNKGTIDAFRSGYSGAFLRKSMIVALEQNGCNRSADVLNMVYLAPIPGSMLYYTSMKSGKIPVRTESRQQSETRETHFLFFRLLSTEALINSNTSWNETTTPSAFLAVRLERETMNLETVPESQPAHR
ncbi:uncharacterized protein EV420DRAFT_1486091 [Desarmillaria tabescens]|uniref:Uncharacterized protein n=1 Tax=Armillaria tabescens TaxID=1929756 RepID=A0AA39MMS1_ARMTA|nr:uncharacterized protein EV420DRAFT_1486091 [Desarmillaria tabescens]KAK0439997.1 hypothetical protein EV420DRAFT_1486091 [Desarmillaria tabescens]